MTKDVIELAREAGLVPASLFVGIREWQKTALAKFAALVAARERERIAKVFDRRAHPVWGFYEPEEPAKIIRALNTEGEGNDKQPASD